MIPLPLSFHPQLFVKSLDFVTQGLKFLDLSLQKSPSQFGLRGHAIRRQDACISVLALGRLEVADLDHSRLHEGA